MALISEPTAAPDEGAVLGIDIGGATVKTGIVGPALVRVEAIPTTTVDDDWSVERLVDIAGGLHAAAEAAGLSPAVLTVNANGQVDEYHGAVQYSPNLPWHDVPVAARVARAVPCEVIVRHSVRAAALAESNLGAARDAGGMLFISLGVGIIAAGSSSGVVVADHVGAGDIGTIRIRSGPGEGRILDDFASPAAIARRHAQAVGVDEEGVTAADVHAALDTDPVARKIWDEAVDALADGLEWSTMLFAPDVLVLGGGAALAGDDLLDPLTAAVRRRFPADRAPQVRLAAFGPYAGLAGAVLTGWKKAGWSVTQLDGIIDALRGPVRSGVAGDP